MRGFIPVTVNETFLARMKGISALDTTLSPCDSLSIRGTTLVLMPLLDCLVVVVVVVLVITARPGTERDAADVKEWSRNVLEEVDVPDHCVCHAFQTVPIEFLFCARMVLKLPSRLIISAGVLSVSNHSSPDGESLQIPVQVKFRTGLRFSTLLAYPFCATTT